MLETLSYINVCLVYSSIGLFLLLNIPEHPFLTSKTECDQRIPIRFQRTCFYENVLLRICFKITDAQFIDNKGPLKRSN